MDKLSDEWAERLWMHAQAMAEAVNGGDWLAHYTDAQRAGWLLKAAWAVEELQRVPGVLAAAKRYLGGPNA